MSVDRDKYPYVTFEKGHQTIKKHKIQEVSKHQNSYTFFQIVKGTRKDLESYIVNFDGKEPVFEYPCFSFYSPKHIENQHKLVTHVQGAQNYCTQLSLKLKKLKQNESYSIDKVAPGINSQPEAHNNSEILKQRHSKWESIYNRLGFHLIDKEAPAPLIEYILTSNLSTEKYKLIEESFQKGISLKNRKMSHSNEDCKKLFQELRSKERPASPKQQVQVKKSLLSEQSKKILYERKVSLLFTEEQKKKPLKKDEQKYNITIVPKQDLGQTLKKAQTFKADPVKEMSEVEVSIRSKETTQELKRLPHLERAKTPKLSKPRSRCSKLQVQKCKSLMRGSMEQYPKERPITAKVLGDLRQLAQYQVCGRSIPTNLIKYSESTKVSGDLMNYMEDLWSPNDVHYNNTAYVSSNISGVFNKNRKLLKAFC